MECDWSGGVKIVMIMKEIEVILKLSLLTLCY